MPPKYRVRRSYMEWMLDPQKRGMKKGYKCAVMRDVTPKNEPKRRFKGASIKRCAKYKGTRGPYTNKTNKQCIVYNNKTPKRCIQYFNFD